MFTKHDDLDFAEDIALSSKNHQKMQDKLTKVEKELQKQDFLSRHWVR